MSSNTLTPPASRPDLALLDEGDPRLCALAGWARMLSNAEARAVIREEEVDAALSMIAQEIDRVRALLARWREHHEL